MKRFVGFTALFLFSPAWAGAFTIQPWDIFQNDSATRRKPTDEQLLWTVQLDGCTGSMLTPKYLITAQHCGIREGDTFTSGACLAMGCKDDLEVASVVEDFDEYDVTIAEVSWSRRDTARKQRYSPAIERNQHKLKVGKDRIATELFTVGFPGDQISARYATGHAKALGVTKIRYNIGVINGNSGGAVWTLKDHKLITLTNGGPHALHSDGWDDNDLEDSAAWNHGPRLDLLYGESQALQDVFPSGINDLVDGDGYLK